MVGGRTAAVLWDIAPRTCSVQLVVVLCNCRQAFSPHVLLGFVWSIHIAVLIRLLLGGKKQRFILSDRSNFHMIDSLSIAVYAFASRVWMSFSVDDTLCTQVQVITVSNLAQSAGAVEYTDCTLQRGKNPPPQ